jgi:hypothetical protein
MKSERDFSLIVLNIMDDYRKGVDWARRRGLTIPLNDSGMDARYATTARTVSNTYQFPRSTPQFYVLTRTGTVALAVLAEAAGTTANQNVIQKLLADTA